MKLVPNSNFSGSQKNHFLFSLLPVFFFLHCSLPHRASFSDYHLLFQLSFLETSAFTYIFLQGDVNGWANEVLKQLLGIILFITEYEHVLWVCELGSLSGGNWWNLPAFCLQSSYQSRKLGCYRVKFSAFCLSWSRLCFYPLSSWESPLPCSRISGLKTSR